MGSQFLLLNKKIHHLYMKQLQLDKPQKGAPNLTANICEVKRRYNTSTPPLRDLFLPPFDRSSKYHKLRDDKTHDHFLCYPKNIFYRLITSICQIRKTKEYGSLYLISQTPFTFPKLELNIIHPINLTAQPSRMFYLLVLTNDHCSIQ